MALTDIFNTILDIGEYSDDLEWEQRLKDCQFKSPSGIVIPLLYEDLSRSINKKVSLFQTINGNGQYAQDNGFEGFIYPSLFFFEGDSHDIQAQAFIDALLETGEGVFTHPVDGDVNVVCSGTITREDRLKTAANQTIFTLTFVETTGLQVGQEQARLAQLAESFESASAETFADKINVSDEANEATFKEKIKRTTETIKLGLKAGQKLTTQSSQNIDDITQSINDGIDLLVGEPLTLARQIQLLNQQPASAIDDIRAKLDAYGNLARGIFGQDDAQANEYDYNEANSFNTDNLVASSLVENSALATNSSEDYVSKNDYFNAALSIGGLLYDLINWKDDNFKSIGDVEILDKSSTETDGGYLDLFDLVSESIKSLIVRSYDAKTEFRFTLDEPRVPLELCYELYGTEDKYDFFRETNELGGDETWIIEPGREIVYYL